MPWLASPPRARHRPPRTHHLTVPPGSTGDTRVPLVPDATDEVFDYFAATFT